MGLLQNVSGSSFQKALYQLWGTAKDRKKFFQQAVFDEAVRLLGEKEGLAVLFQYAHLFDQAGVFLNRSWENVRHLQPPLVRGTLQAGGGIAAAETLSNLRILAIARGSYQHPEMASNEANEYITKVLALNMDLLLMRENEENRMNMLFKDEIAAPLISFMADHCYSPRIFSHIEKEIENLAVQRPIVVEKILRLISSARKLTGGSDPNDSVWRQYEKAVYSPTDIALKGGNYLEVLKRSDDLVLIREAEQLRCSMEKTGLVSSFHVVFLIFINDTKPHLLENMLAGNFQAKKNIKCYLPNIQKVIRSAGCMQWRQSIYGLCRLLGRDIVTPELLEGLEQTGSIEIHQTIREQLRNARGIKDEKTMRSALLAGMVSVLGQPLGIGQGFNPACQSTRALSYWSQKNPLLLLGLFTKVITEGRLIIEYEGTQISTENLDKKALEDQENIDIVSLVMLPHLQAAYVEMLQQTGYRGQDTHKWVNPAFYIDGVWQGFADIYNNPDFLSLFRMYYQPEFLAARTDSLPQPAGITIYDRDGNPLGAHAILIQRVAPDPSGTIRVYFYNPNNDGLQTWGRSITTSVNGNGEREGESSLRLQEFLLCLYAFHYPI
ncbi:hypothetical protein [Bacillus sp. T33-2]|uniref:hypothetical protein n=1 Tax=Bacillus sp. T33-2 TaxID=2054168 RepID=UPI000C78A4FB|nr:hypothetical protein [Bacillus sp. T33-2]PLR96841.1 hypothetical protein CVD19_10790 [Bacillus sp. T33-2]